jgi:RNA polymerase sigma-70 factor (ECF subfamily)
VTPTPSPPEDSHRALQALATQTLLARARSGDSRAREVLLQRYRPRLVQWAHGRLPIQARGGLDTEDVVQNTLLKALNPLERFEPRHEGAFLGYLCRIALNLIRDESRKARRRPPLAELDDLQVDGHPSPLDQAIGQDEMRRYEEAMCRLSEDHATAIRLRLELQYSYEEMAAAMGRPSENAVRLLLQRAIRRLAWEMHERREGLRS